MIDRRALVRLGAISTAAGLLARPALAQRRNGNGNGKAPNIIFILADDLGFADIGRFGRSDIATPNLDRLAAGGVSLFRSYSNSSVCSPTRLALMTGLYQYRLPAGLDEPLGTNAALGLPPAAWTLPRALGRAGYRTALVGKWHLGVLPEFGPLKSGYDRFFGIYQGGADYFRHGMTIRGRFEHDLWEGEERAHAQGYLTDLITQRSVAEIGRLAGDDRPFFLSVHYTAPHWPWEGPEDEAAARKLADSRHYDGGSAAIYASMIRSLDKGVGAILDALEAAGIADDSLIIFTSDNGGERFSKMWPLRGMKGELLEGGIRVPTIVRWPGRIAADSASDLVHLTMDWAPTLLAAAGVDPDTPLDGENLLPALVAGTQGGLRTLFWRHHAQQQAAAIAGKHKYLRFAGAEYLFDLESDPLEVANLKSSRPEILQRLKAEFTAWNAQMLPYPDGSFSYDFRGTGHLAGY